MTNRHLNPAYAEFGTTIFGEMSALAARTGAINLGQGFPDADGPAEVLEAAVAAMRAGHNQYPPATGIAPLREAIARHQRRFYDLAYDPDDEVLVTAGATEAIAATVLALCRPGDEVVAFEPFYDSYAACIAMAGATRRAVPLRPVAEPGPGRRRGAFTLDLDELEAAITPRTRLLLLNSPHNPTGRVLSRPELERIAELCRRHDLIAVTDEVYEHLVFDGEHIPLATLPGMRERTVLISSAGKTFSFTGWKIGWVCATSELVSAVRTTKQFLTYVNGAPFQHAIAVGLDLGDDFYDGFTADLAARRDLLADGLAAAGLRVFDPAGTYFVTTDIGPLGERDGMAFCRSLPERAGVVAIPCQVFCDDPDLGATLVRFAFCKQPHVLHEASERLARLRPTPA